jgi:hypothetical protein
MVAVGDQASERCTVVDPRHGGQQPLHDLGVGIHQPGGDLGGEVTLQDQQADGLVAGMAALAPAKEIRPSFSPARPNPERRVSRPPVSSRSETGPVFSPAGFLSSDQGDARARHRALFARGLGPAIVSARGSRRPISASCSRPHPNPSCCFRPSAALKPIMGLGSWPAGVRLPARAAPGPFPPARRSGSALEHEVAPPTTGKEHVFGNLSRRTRRAISGCFASACAPSVNLARTAIHGEAALARSAARL